MSEGCARYWNIRNLADDGIRPLYRKASWRKTERAVKGAKKLKSWYGADYKSVLFVQSTPGGVLKQALSEVVKESGLKVRVVEKGGRSLQSLLQKSDVGNNIMCGGPECVLCRTGGKGPCNREGVCYKVTCMKCLENEVNCQMFGETGRTARIRCGEHMKALKGRKNSNLWEHCVTVHGGEEVNFRYDVMSIHSGDPLKRQLSEALNIQKGAKELDHRMNDKNEWVRPAGLDIEVRRM